MRCGTPPRRPSNGRAVDERELRTEVERRLERRFEDVQEQLTELFDLEWDEVETVILTSAERSDRSEADVIVDLVDRAEATPPVQQRVRRAVIRWIGKPWRERENPWDRYKHKIPEPPSTDPDRSEDLDEWTPYRPEEHE